MSVIGKRIIDWYATRGRALPWRETREPYSIWIAETILQQTRIQQGIGYFYRFMERFPDVDSLAEADLDEVLKYWEGLGYYSRARNLHAAAQQLQERFGGTFPQDHATLMELKGVGPYTARAISSFAFGKSTAVLDGNIMRVVSRLLADPAPSNAQKTRNKWQKILDEWVAGHDSRTFNHAMMDLGSTVCTPKKPDCSACPFRTHCNAWAQDLIESLPQKKKTQRKTRHFQFALLYNDLDEIAVQKRPMNGFWGGLYEIPNREVSAEAWEKAVPEGLSLHHEFKHVFSHFDMKIKVFEGHANYWPITSQVQFIANDKISIFAFSKAVLKIFEQFGF